MSPDKNNKKKIFIILTLLTIFLLILTVKAEENITQCSDGLDNDNDGLIDSNDLGCTSLDDNDEIDCYMNTDCGIDACAGGDNYCENNDVFQIFRFFTCNNPGQNNATCSNYTSPFLIFDCGESYCEGYNENYCYEDNVYKERICYNKGCANKDCFNNQITEQELVKECNNGCKNGKCKSKEAGKWRDYPNTEPEQIPLKTSPSNFTQIENSLQKIIIQNKEVNNKSSTKNWMIILLILITALLIFILTSLSQNSN